MSSSAKHDKVDEAEEEDIEEEVTEEEETIVEDIKKKQIQQFTKVRSGNGIIFILDHINGSAAVSDVESYYDDVLTVPRSFNFEGKEYLVTRCLQEIKFGQHKKICFPPDSEVLYFGDTSHCFQTSYSKLETLEIPPKLKKIEKNFINAALSLKEINVSPYNRNFVYENGILFNSDKSVIFYCNQSITHLVVPFTVKKIGSSACERCSILKTVEFEHVEGKTNIKSIGRDAFNRSKIENIMLPRSVEVISASAFSGCKYLNNVFFEKDSKLRVIEETAFFKCKSLKYFECDGPVEFIGNCCFSYNPNNQFVKLPKTQVLNVIGYAMSDMPSDFSLIVPKSCNVKIGEKVNIERI